MKHGLHTEMPHDYDWKPTKECKNCWWIMLIIAAVLAVVSLVLLIVY